MTDKEDREQLEKITKELKESKSANDSSTKVAPDAKPGNKDEADKTPEETWTHNPKTNETRLQLTPEEIEVTEE